MKFLLDTHLPQRLVREFTALGHECLQVRDLLSADAADTTIAKLANKLLANVVTKDADFADLAARGVLHTSLVWIRLGNNSSAMLCEKLRPKLPAVCAALEAGERRIDIHD